MTKLFPTLFFLLFCIHTHAQLKLWDKNGNPKKIKGALLEVEALKPDTLSNELPGDKEDKNAFLSAIGGPLAGAAASALIYGLEQTLKVDSSKYSAALPAVTNTLVKLDSNTRSQQFALHLNYFPKGSKTTKETAFTHLIQLTKSDRELRFSLNPDREKYLPIKTRTNYDFVLLGVEVTASVWFINDKKELEKKSIGTASMMAYNPNYQTDNEYLNIHTTPFSASLLLAKQEVSWIELAFKISYKNPYGNKRNGLNAFIEANKDPSTELLKAILMPKEAETDSDAAKN